MEIVNRTFLTVLFLSLALRAEAADFGIKTAETAVPTQLAEPIRAVREPKTVQLLQDGKPRLETWFRREIPLKNSAAKIDSRPETTLVGAVTVRGAGLRDYKDNEIPEG